MKKAWIFLADRFDALKPRERLIVFLGLVACMVVLFYLAAFQPVLARYQKAHEILVESDKQLNLLNTQEVGLIEASAKDLDSDTKVLNKQVKADNARMREALAKAQAQLATPDKMAEVLRDLIASQKGLELISIRSGKAEDLLAPETGVSEPVIHEESIFRQSIEVDVRGDYATLAAYMKKVEALPWKFYLAQMSLKVDHYPVSTMNLKLYTLSLERAWLGF